MVKLEVGKYYKSSHGRKYKCVHDFSNKVKFHLGRFLCVCDDGNGGHDYRFHESGKNSNQFCGVELISEWVEPVEHEVEVHFYKQELNGRVLARDSGASLTGWKNVAKVKVKFTEGEGL